MYPKKCIQHTGPGRSPKDCPAAAVRAEAEPEPDPPRVIEDTYLPRGWSIHEDGQPYYRSARDYPRKGVWTVCTNCGKRFPVRTNSHIKGLFCSHLCAGVLKVASGNPDLFAAWTPEEAWLAGLIWSDGCLNEPGRSTRRTWGWRLTLGVTDKELIDHAATLMQVAILTSSPKDRKSRYDLKLNRAEPIARLRAIGLEPRKSLTARFPDLPDRVLRHFIRGCFDGDGSVGIHPRNTRYNAARGWPPDPHLNACLCGARPFLEGLQEVLHRQAGIAPKKVYLQRGTTIPMVRWQRADSLRLYEYMYGEGGPCLTRKRRVFERGTNLLTGPQQMGWSRAQGIAQYWARRNGAHGNPALPGILEDT